MYHWLKPLLFRLDPETVHDLALNTIAKGLLKGPCPNQIPANNSLQRELFGVTFPNPLGLAPGFDKNAVAVEHWHRFGFGFVEIGTVTRHPQPGNPKPRLFRIPENQALVNRLGFNNQGADAIANRLARSQPKIPVGVNIGKSKITPLEEAAEDYAYSFKKLLPHGDYFVVNVSSPNTPGLRQLQDRDHLTKVLWRLREIDSEKPLFVKIAPDLAPEALDEIIEVALDFQLAGLVATNTTIARDTLPDSPNAKQEGGLSGEPLKTKADDVLRHLAQAAADKLTLIGVGGITTPAHAAEKLALGASLVQIYTGWVYGGPDFPAQITAHLEQSH